MSLTIPVELFGTPRLRTGRGRIDLELHARTTRQEVVAVLATACPELVGYAILSDLSDLEQGFVFNLSGREFLGDDPFSLKPGDSLLLLSSQAGG